MYPVLSLPIQGKWIAVMYLEELLNRVALVALPIMPAPPSRIEGGVLNYRAVIFNLKKVERHLTAQIFRRE